MAETKPAVDGQAAAPVITEPSTVSTKTEDLEATILALEAERAKAIEEASNYKLAFLKEKNKNEIPDGETDEDRIRRITNEELSKKKIEHIDSEKDRLLKELARENKELKLAQMNPVNKIPPSNGGGDAPVVKDTLITSEQLTAFKARGWSDKDIERYKSNLQKQIR